ncbi:hypothetical protein CBOM_01581 [Ceraceosorus bombacis]|uniref:Uncharacterized protein n=1 Tax=Ceraceosorus bombacis TaxID=401625 RepID=A0A0P1BEC3_9BASI|nr:hypothetical protein CBOM_01581 [Ceraceosorus bombacis]
MKDLFERERQNTAELLAREQAERARQEDKVKALEAQQAKLPQGVRSLAGDGVGAEELEKLKAKHAKQVRQLEEALEREQESLSRHKVSEAR